MVMLQKWSLERRWPVSRRENGCYRDGQRENSRVTEVVSLMQGEWSCCRSGHLWNENGHVTEMDSFMEGEWLCYGGAV